MTTMPDQKTITTHTPAKVFTGYAGQLRNSEWLAAEDIAGLGDIEVEIEDVLLYDEVTFDLGRKERNVPTLKFKGKDKQMVLRTSANRKQLVRKFGTDTRKWRGQKIVIYHDPTVRFGGKTVGGIRIR